MRKNIDIDDITLTKLKVISAFENLSVKALMEKAVRFFVEHKEKEQYDNMSQEAREDAGLYILMQQADKNDLVNRDEIMNILDE
ncbi:MAG: hypothetical protein COB60_05480 [Flavobacteriaceae bacterium]|nr:MAG: hypothetical protein COB60_05480 [Flavobacteriaceae bacterium]